MSGIYYRVICISIHAPTRGATRLPQLLIQDLQFQSTLPRGERPGFVCGNNKNPLISIHAPTRGATWSFTPVNPIIFISIHAPTRGATSKTWGYFLKNKISIHAPTRGATDKYGNTIDTKQISIHAPTRGATPEDISFGENVVIFQSTLPRGERLETDRNSDDWERISIHAPTRGATLIASPVNDIWRFQSTLPRGERPIGV